MVFRYLLFLQTMLRARPPQTLSLTDTLSQAGDMSGTLDLTLSSKVPQPGLSHKQNDTHKSLPLTLSCVSPEQSGSRKRVESSSQQQWVQQQAATAELVHNVVVGIFDELYAHPETRIHLADALDFLVRYDSPFLSLHKECVRCRPPSVCWVDVGLVGLMPVVCWGVCQVVHRGGGDRARPDEAQDGLQGQQGPLALHLPRHRHRTGETVGAEIGYSYSI